MCTPAGFDSGERRRRLKHFPGNGSSYGRLEGRVVRQRRRHVLHQPSPQLLHCRRRRLRLLRPPSRRELLHHLAWRGGRLVSTRASAAACCLGMRCSAVVVLAFVRRHQYGRVLGTSLHLQFEAERSNWD